MAIADDLRRLSESVSDLREENARVMGRIEQKVDSAQKTIDEREDYAARYRAETRQKLEDVVVDVAAVATSVEQLRPVVVSLSNLRAKAAGAVVVLASLGAFLGWLGTTFADDLRAIVSRIFFH